jgi:spermidine synthase
MQRVFLRPAFLYALFFLSGAAGLGYQMIWIRQFTAGLGHELPSVISVTAAFLGGMAVGAWMLDRAISTSAAPGRWYASLEFVIGGWGVAMALSIPTLNRLVLDIIGPTPSVFRQWTMVFAVPFLGLLPATVAMGATLPAMDRFLAPLMPARRCIGALYAANTLGAVAGTLASVFVLAPALGFRASGFVLAALNVLCGFAALAMSKAVPDHPGSSAVTPPECRHGLSAMRLNVTLIGTGLVGVGYELVGVRVLSQVLENTLFSFAAVLSVYLVGTALGAALYQCWGGRVAFRSLLFSLLVALASSGILGICVLHRTPELYDILRTRFGDSALGVLLAEMSVAGAVFALPTLLMGAAFSHLVQGARHQTAGVGRAAALNTIGCAAAGLFFVFGALPVMGSKWTLVVISFGYLLLLPWLRTRAWLSLAIPVALSVVLPRDLHLITLPPGARIIEYREGAMAAVSVLETPDHQRSLRVNNRFQMGGTAAAVAERRQAHIPLLLHLNPERALFLGPGTGITLGAATAYTNVLSDVVELLPEVVVAMRAFEPENEGPFPRPGVHIMVGDARRFVRTTSHRYSVIVGDLFHPAQDGAGFLYTVEHFTAIRARLLPGGLFCQWLPLHQLDEATLQVIVRTFLEVFPEGQAWLLHFNVDIPVIGLVGTSNGLRLAPDSVEQQGRSSDCQERLRAVSLDRTINLLGCYAGGPKALAKFAHGAALNTDDHPVVSFLAPRFTYRREPQPADLLTNFLSQCAGEASEVVFPGPAGKSEAFIKNLNAFFAARDLYLKGLLEEGAGHLARAIDLYLAAARHSLYFTPAYARCLTIVQVIAATDREAAFRLLDRLEEAQPGQPLGGKMRDLLLQRAPVR